MDNLNIDELKQLVTFFKNRANEAEFNLLQSQLLVNRLSNEKQKLETDLININTKNTSLSSKNDELQTEVDKLKKKSKKKGN